MLSQATTLRLGEFAANRCRGKGAGNNPTKTEEEYQMWARKSAAQPSRPSPVGTTTEVRLDSNHSTTVLLEL